MFMDMTEKKLSETTVYDGKIFRVHRDDVALSDGSQSVREIVEHHGGVCCAALNDRGEIALVRQFRYAYGRIVTELPAGKLERGEDPSDAIRRELREEVGAIGTDWQEMGKLYPTPGYCTEIIHLYRCRVTSIGDTDFDDDECIETLWMPLEQAMQMVMSGEIADSKTQVLILKTYLMEMGTSTHH